MRGAEAMNGGLTRKSPEPEPNLHSSSFKFLSVMMISLSKHIHDWMFTSVWRAGREDAQSQLSYEVRGS